MEDIKKIVLTGGPCSGKSSALPHIESLLLKRGHRPLFVPEAATSLITAGIRPELLGDKFQEYVIRQQLHNESLAMDAAKRYAEQGARPVIILDRGLMDGAAYMDTDSFKKLAETFGASFLEWLQRYDAVIALEVAPRDFYTIDNNAARSEDYEGACKKGENTKAAWKGSKLFVVGNPEEGGFEKKMRDVGNIVLKALGEPPVEVEYKWIVESIDMDSMFAMNPRVFKIEQSYLTGEKEGEERVRKLCHDGSCLYYHSIKKVTGRGRSMERIEIERKISEEDYNFLLERRDPGASTIRKTRYVFLWKDRQFELDVLEHKNSGGIPKYLLELELPDANLSADELELPNFIIDAKLDDGSFSNAQIAKLLAQRQR